MCSILSMTIFNTCIWSTLHLSYANAFYLDRSKILSFGHILRSTLIVSIHILNSLRKDKCKTFFNGQKAPFPLTHYQTTNFRLFQTKEVCRRQLQIWRKWQKVIQTGRKHCGKRRNYSLWAISPFPKVFSKGLFPRGVKRCHCVGMG